MQSFTKRVVPNALFALLFATHHQRLLTYVRGQEPAPCATSNNVVGFGTVRELNEHMGILWQEVNKRPDTAPRPPYRFVLCPHTVYDDDYIFPMLNDTWILCGPEGSLDDNCTLSSSETSSHVVLQPLDDVSGVTSTAVERVHFAGLTMTDNNEGVSVKAYGTQNSFATFHRCHWRVSFVHPLGAFGAVGRGDALRNLTSFFAFRPSLISNNLLTQDNNGQFAIHISGNGGNAMTVGLDNCVFSVSFCIAQPMSSFRFTT